MTIKDIVKGVKAQIDKKYGSENRTYTTFNELVSIPKTHTGSLYFDYALGGGFVEGRIYNLYGPPSSGKSAIATMLCAEHQKNGLPIAYFDAEAGFDPVYAKNTFGFDIEDENTVLFSQEDDGGKIYTTAEICAKGGFKLIVIDSTDAMLTSAESEADYDQAMMTQKARLNSLALAKLKGILNDYKCSLILISQERDSIGTYSKGPTVSGGQAIKFYSSVRARVSRKEILKVGDDAIGQKIKVAIQKNKIGIPFREVELSLKYNNGFQKSDEIIELALKYELIVRGGSYYTYGSQFKLQGKESVLQWFSENDNAFRELETTVKSALLGEIAKKSVPIIEADESVDTEIEKVIKTKKGSKEVYDEVLSESEMEDAFETARKVRKKI